MEVLTPDVLIGPFPGAGGSAAPGGDAGVHEEAPERRGEAEGPRAAAEGLQHHQQQRTQSAADLQQHGGIIIHRLTLFID